MNRSKIGVILSTTRAGRFADRPARWVLDIAKARDDADYEIVDLRDYPIAYFDAPASPRFVPVPDPVALRFAAKMAELDGYIFITAEYNRAIPAVLKNALDHIYSEPARKPAAFVGYGAVGGSRAVEQLRLIAVELSMVPMKAGVHINMEPLLGMIRDGKDFPDYPYLVPTVTAMLDELAWYTKVLKAGRESQTLERAA